MKTVKLNSKLNFLFFLLMLFIGMICIGVTAFGQTDSIKQQPYGDSTLVDLDFEMIKGRLHISFYADSSLLEVISITYFLNEKPSITRVTDFSADGKFDIEPGEVNDIFFKTTTGITSVNYIQMKKKKGYIIINGKLIAKISGKNFDTELGETSADFFKDTIHWQYDPSLLN